MLVHYIDDMMLMKPGVLVWDSPEDPETGFQVLLVHQSGTPRKRVEGLGNKTAEGKQTVSKLLLWITRVTFWEDTTL